MISLRELSRDEVRLIWSIDRSETIEGIYYAEQGALVLRPERYVLRGWPPGEPEQYTPILLDCFDRGGWFCGAFDDGVLVGVAVLESRFIGAEGDQLQLKLLHVSCAYRNRGLGRQLFAQAQATARARQARRLYVSATPSENTIRFYLRRGCAVTREPDPELLALEPDDIHLECPV